MLVLNTCAFLRFMHVPQGKTQQSRAVLAPETPGCQALGELKNWLRNGVIWFWLSNLPTEVAAVNAVLNPEL